MVDAVEVVVADVVAGAVADVGVDVVVVEEEIMTRSVRTRRSNGVTRTSNSRS